jgi:hypothetical protein
VHGQDLVEAGPAIYGIYAVGVAHEDTVVSVAGEHFIVAFAGRDLIVA